MPYTFGRAAQSIKMSGAFGRNKLGSLLARSPLLQVTPVRSLLGRKTCAKNGEGPKGALGGARLLYTPRSPCTR